MSLLGQNLSPDWGKLDWTFLNFFLVTEKMKILSEEIYVCQSPLLLVYALPLNPCWCYRPFHHHASINYPASFSGNSMLAFYQGISFSLHSSLFLWLYRPPDISSNIIHFVVKHLILIWSLSFQHQTLIFGRQVYLQQIHLPFKYEILILKTAGEIDEHLV